MICSTYCRVGLRQEATGCKQTSKFLKNHKITNSHGRTVCVEKSELRGLTLGRLRAFHLADEWQSPPHLQKFAFTLFAKKQNVKISEHVG